MRKKKQKKLDSICSVCVYKAATMTCPHLQFVTDKLNLNIGGLAVKPGICCGNFRCLDVYSYLNSWRIFVLSKDLQVSYLTLGEACCCDKFFQVFLMCTSNMYCFFAVHSFDN